MLLLIVVSEVDVEIPLLDAEIDDAAELVYGLIVKVATEVVVASVICVVE